MADTLETWLGRVSPRLVPGFPAALEALYGVETALLRLRAVRISTFTGILAGLALAPALWVLMPGAHAAIRFWWLQMGLPAGMICHAILWTRLSVRRQELQSAFFGLVVALCFSRLMMSATTDAVTFYFAGMLLLMLLDVVGGGFSFALGAVFAGSLIAMFGVCVQYMPGASGLPGLVDAGLMGVCSLFAAYGAWRVETETRRSWALMLRERLQRRALADDNSVLADLARRDPLTGLANRRAYEVFEQASWRRAESEGVPLGLIVVDIDHFKKYNDFYGHAAGDLCLQSVARCLAEQLRGDGDLVARIGGEEFAILLPDIGIEAAGDIAERVRHAVAALQLPHLGCNTAQTVTVSCGACSFVPAPGAEPKDLFSAADAALYAAKQAGRNRVCLADAAAPTSASAVQTASIKLG